MTVNPLEPALALIKSVFDNSNVELLPDAIAGCLISNVEPYTLAVFNPTNDPVFVVSTPMQTLEPVGPVGPFT